MLHTATVRPTLLHLNFPVRGPRADSYRPPRVAAQVSEGYSGEHELVLGGYNQVPNKIWQTWGRKNGKLDVRLQQQVRGVGWRTK